jgi:hypothetical protein
MLHIFVSADDGGTGRGEQYPAAQQAECGIQLPPIQVPRGGQSYQQLGVEEIGRISKRKGVRNLLQPKRNGAIDTEQEGRNRFPSRERG